MGSDYDDVLLPNKERCDQRLDLRSALGVFLVSVCGGGGAIVVSFSKFFVVNSRVLCVCSIGSRARAAVGRGFSTDTIYNVLLNRHILGAFSY